MIIGLILFYIGMYFANCTECLSTSMLYVIPILYVADTVNDYFKWWWTPLDFPDYKNTRFIFVETIMILGGVAFFYITNEGTYSVFTLHGITVVCMIALGFKHFSASIGHLFSKKKLSDSH